VLDLDRVEQNYRGCKAAMPLARIYYAVKANPAAPMLDRLVGLGSCFDAASFEEVQACLDSGAAPESISYGNTVKKESAIRAGLRARRPHVRLRLRPETAQARPLRAGRARVLPHPGRQRRGGVAAVAQVRLRGRDGARADGAGGELGLDPFGLSFHVGSQQVKTAAYEAAIAKVGHAASPTCATRG
jgi:ornithine decarboxylase